MLVPSGGVFLVVIGNFAVQLCCMNSYVHLLFSAACAAASLAIGTRKGEQDT